MTDNKPNPDLYKITDLYTLLKEGASNNYFDFLVDGLKDTFGYLCKIDLSFKPIGPNHPMSGYVDGPKVKTFWMNKIGVEIKEDHKLFDSKSTFKYVLAPKSILKAPQRRKGVSKNSSNKENKSSGDPKGDQGEGKAGSSSANSTEKVPEGKAGSSSAMLTEKVPEGKAGSSSAMLTEKEPEAVPGKDPFNTTINVPEGTADTLNKYKTNLKVRAEIAAGKTLVDNSEKFRANFNKMFEEFEENQKTAISNLETQIKSAVSSANGALDVVNKVKKKQKTQDDRLKRIEDENKRNRELITELTDKLNNQPPAIMGRPSVITAYTLIAYYDMARCRRMEYKAAIAAAQKAARMKMDIVPTRKNRYITTHIDEHDQRVETLNNEAVERQIFRNPVFRNQKYQIFEVAIVNKANGNISAFFSINVNYARRQLLGKQLLQNRADNTGEFGLSLDTPLKYNIDATLLHIKKNIIDPVSNLPVIHDFDKSIFGFYVIYLNDARTQGWRPNMQDEFGKEIKEKRYCTRLYPWNPLDFAEIKQENLTYANLLLLADDTRYFTFKGDIHEIPKKPETVPIEPVVVGDSESGDSSSSEDEEEDKSNGGEDDNSSGDDEGNANSG